MPDSDIDIVGVPPQIVGKHCQALLCQQYWYQGRLTEAALSTFLKFENQWHRLFLDFNTIFWRPQEEEPESWNIPEKGFDYPLINLGGFLKLEGAILLDFTSESIEGAIGVRIIFTFDDGYVVVLENRNDITHLLVRSANVER